MKKSPSPLRKKGKTEGPEIANLSSNALHAFILCLSKRKHDEYDQYHGSLTPRGSKRT